MELGILFIRNCDNCGAAEERVMVDSFTGKELCLMCLAPVVNQITMSPASEGDNINDVLKKDGRGEE